MVCSFIKTPFLYKIHVFSALLAREGAFHKFAQMNGAQGIAYGAVQLIPQQGIECAVDMRAFFIERGFGCLKQRYFNRVQYIESGDERSIA